MLVFGKQVSDKRPKEWKTYQAIPYKNAYRDKLLVLSAVKLDNAKTCKCCGTPIFNLVGNFCSRACVLKAIDQS